MNFTDLLLIIMGGGLAGAGFALVVADLCAWSSDRKKPCRKTASKIASLRPAIPPKGKPQLHVHQGGKGWRGASREELKG